MGGAGVGVGGGGVGVSVVVSLFIRVTSVEHIYSPLLILHKCSWPHSD